MKKWIAIVDDNIEHLKNVSRLLSEEGFKVSTLRDREALPAFLEGNRPDVIFFDASEPYVILSQLTGGGRGNDHGLSDGLTGLMDEETVYAAVSEMIPEAGGTFLSISIDGFELLDELYGKEKGDAVLIRFASILRSSLRASDPIGRIGRSGFAAFGEHIREEFVIAEKTSYLQDMLNDFVSDYFKGRDALPLQVVVGAVVCPDEGQELKVLLEKAEEARYLAAEKGGYAFFWSNRHPRGTRMTASMNEMVALLSERENTGGAYVTSFEHFRTICRFLMRVSDYQEIHALLICFTLQISPEYKETRERVLGHFEEVVAKSLRASDVIARHGEDQLTVLLAFTHERYGETVARRIESQWKKSDYSDECLPIFDIHHLQE